MAVTLHGILSWFLFDWWIPLDMALVVLIAFWLKDDSALSYLGKLRRFSICYLASLAVMFVTRAVDFALPDIKAFISGCVIYGFRWIVWTAVIAFILWCWNPKQQKA